MAATPLILVPGVQGRWEYMRPAVDALSREFRVLTFSLGAARTLDDFVAQVARRLDDNHVDRAVVCGVSFGGLIAVRFAAVHPERTSALVLASTPAPRLRLRRRHQLYLRCPWIFGPLFFAEAPWRLHAEIVSAMPSWRARWALRLGVLRELPGAPVSFSQMAARARMVSTTDLTTDCLRVTAPTLVVTGERALDHVVPVDGASEYARLIPNARAAVIERTGHIGSITRPDAFAALVRDFVNGQRHAAA
ncbi:MAG TPA: alpha/beta hydrolase [Vicinamibacterales bacterium]|jgi:pimeloyl-ACP methyl ester carboxylesterase|nr:alpha/beta hydrolase [Vicinamibacterales bacterium]